MKSRARWLFLTVLALLISLTAAQVRAAPTHSPQAPGSLVRFLHLTQEDGLSQNAGLAFLQDSRGFVWIGTQDGLNCYDGHAFTVYKNDPDNPTSLSHNSINALMEDRAGQIWIGTWGGGLNRFDPRTQQFTRFKHDEAKPSSLSADNVMDVVADDGGALWVSTYGSGLNRMELAVPGQFVHYRNNPYIPESLSGDETWALLQDRSELLWIGTARNGLNLLPDNTNSLAADAVGAFDEDARMVQSGGLFAFTTKVAASPASDQQKYDRQRSGDFEIFSHAPAYIESRLAQQTFTRLKTQRCFVGVDLFDLRVARKN